MDFPGPNGHLEPDVCDEFDVILQQLKDITPNWEEYDAIGVKRW